MSDQQQLWENGLGGLENKAPSEAIRASIARELRYLLTISENAGKPYAIRPAGIAHSIGVALIEDFIMARGKGMAKEAKTGAMPRFVDVKLSAEERDGFLSWAKRGGPDLVDFLQSLADDGYRVGVTWAGEQQAYTVSLTCRQSGNVNEGLCMTSFAKTLENALWLAIYKHVVVADHRWLEASGGEEGDFG